MSDAAATVLARALVMCAIIAAVVALSFKFGGWVLIGALLVLLL